jgi:glycosyltransferase involved in cell wall biosynthesis
VTRQRLTALIPAHNDDYILAVCLDSIAPHFDEILVLDDCSTDHTPDVALDAARRHPHVRYLRHDGHQLGWIEARNRLLRHTDSEWLFWLDADDVLCGYQAGTLREIAEAPHPLVRLQLAEMWGDFLHTTQRLRHYDKCHVFVDRRAMRDFAWRGGSAAHPATSVRPRTGPGPLLWHCKGVKPDRRLVERQFIRKWFRAGRPTATVEEFARLDRMDPDEIHRRAVHMLLGSRQDKIRRWGIETGPAIPRAIARRVRARQRFRITYQDGEPADREDRGWAPPGQELNQ